MFVCWTSFLSVVFLVSISNIKGDVPPKTIVLKRERFEERDEKFKLLKFVCEVPDAKPACNKSWNHSGILQFEHQTKTINELGGIDTVSVITINVSAATSLLNITCHAHCGQFYVSAKTTQFNLSIDEPEIIPQVSDLHKGKVLWISVIIVVHVLGVLCIILVGKFFIWVKHGVPRNNYGYIDHV